LVRNDAGEICFGFGEHEGHELDSVCREDAGYMARLLFKADDLSHRVRAEIEAACARNNVALWACSQGKVLRRPDGVLVLGMGEKQGHKGKPLVELAEDRGGRGSGRGFLEWMCGLGDMPDDAKALVRGALARANG
jgi:hypothetical protein